MRHPLLDHQPGTLACDGTKTAQSTVEDSLEYRWTVRRKRVVINGWAATIHSCMQ